MPTRFELQNDLAQLGDISRELEDRELQLGMDITMLREELQQVLNRSREVREDYALAVAEMNAIEAGEEYGL